LRESEGRFRAFVTASSDAVYRMSPDWSELRYVDGRNFIAGTNKPSGTWLAEYLYPDDHASVMAMIEEAIRTKTNFEMEHRVRRLDGSVGWTFSRAVPLLDSSGEIIEWIGAAKDVTERKRAEHALLGSEERYRRLLSQMNEGYCLIEVLFDEHEHAVDYRFLEISPGFAALTGLNGAVGTRILELVPDLDVFWFEFYGRVAVTGEPAHLISEVKAMNRWFEISASKDGGPNSRTVAVFFNNVTKQKEAEAALRESEQAYRTLFDSIDEGFCIIESLFDEHDHPIDYRFLEVNPAFERQTGLLAPHGRRMRELVPAIEAHWIETYGKVARTGEAVRLVSSVKDMGNRWFDVYACRVDEPERRKVALIFNDITARMQVETVLLESERRLRFVMDSMPQKVVTTTPDGVADYFNPQWSEFTGLSLQQITDGGWAQLLHPDDLAEAIRLWQHAVANGEPNRHEQRLRRADGEYRWHLSLAVPMRNATGEITQWIGSVTDVHEVKEANRRKDEFLAMLAHELRNPLAPIRNMLEVLRRAEGNGDLVQPALSTMERQLRHMTRLIDDLLDVSRISNGKISLRPETVELAAVIRQVVEATQPANDAAQQELTVTLPTRPVYVHADPARLAQVLGNLLHNASKFSRPGGKISLTAEERGRDLVVTVEDDGIGISPELLPKIFEMFAQGDQTLERSHSGLGIGLTLVRRLVEMHGGTVEVSSEGPGRGSEFVVHLPSLIEESPTPTPTPSPTLDAPAVAARRILVVDDNHDSAESLSTLLELEGYETRLAFDGVEAVNVTASFRPDVVLMDIGLPQLNGYQAAAQIRSEPWGNAMVLVALTGWGQEEDRRRILEAGFDVHMVKPVDFDTLSKLLAGDPAAVARGRRP
jgi:PAS domain S-box-containing protein